MSNIKNLTGAELISILQKLGFEIIRIKGSHHILRHIDGRRTVVPVHKGETIGIGLLMKVLKDVEISKTEFIELINKK
jgi:predicted RNA binding protein YcfA (HicA-like mRNA interferase family)